MNRKLAGQSQTARIKRVTFGFKAATASDVRRAGSSNKAESP